MRVATEQREAVDARPSVEPPPPRLGGTDIFRGALVIITAIVIGVFVISRGLDEPADTEAAGSEVDPAAAGAEDAELAEADGAAIDGAADAGAATDGEAADGSVDEVLPTATTAADGSTGATGDMTATSAGDGTSTSAPAETSTTVRPAAEVTVLVLNGAGTQGIAARGTETLKAASYLTAAPKNADGGPQPSAVLYAEGYELEAQAVAAVFSAGLESLVQPLDPAAPPIADLQGADVVVVIGNDDLIPVR